MRNIGLRLFLLSLISVFIFSCGDVDKTSRPLKEDFTLDKSGVYYYFHTELPDTNRKPHSGEFVKAYIDWGKRDSIIVSKEMAGGAVEFQIKPMANKANVFEALKLMHIGDSATFIITASDYFHPAQPPEFLKPDDDLYFDIKLLDTKSQNQFMREQHEELMRLRDEEQVLLKDYIEENEIDVEPLESGLYFIKEQEGKGDVVEKGMMLKINYECKLIDGKKVYSTWDLEKPMDFRFGSKFDTPGMNEALAMMREGDRAKLIVPSKIAYGERGRAQFIPPYSSLLYDVEVIEVTTEEEFKNDKVAQSRAKQQKRIKELQKRQNNEPQKITTYINKNYPEVKPNSNGVYFLEREAGDGPTPAVGDSVKVHYRQYLLDGTKLLDTYESQTPFSFVVGKNNVILGWEIAIRNMNEGGKIKILLPSRLAYKDTGAGNLIQPYTPLIYDIELIKLTPKVFQNTGRK